MAKRDPMPDGYDETLRAMVRVRRARAPGAEESRRIAKARELALDCASCGRLGELTELLREWGPALEPDWAMARGEKTLIAAALGCADEGAALACAKALLAAGFDPSLPNAEGATPLLSAAARGSRRLIDWALGAGARISLPRGAVERADNSEPICALATALECDQGEAFWTLEARVELSPMQRARLIEVAARDGAPSVAIEMLERAEWREAVGVADARRGRATILMLAALNGGSRGPAAVELISKLLPLSNPAEVRSLRPEGTPREAYRVAQTAASCALNGSWGEEVVEVLALLRGAGASLERMPGQDLSLLHLAAMRAPREVADWLMSKGASPSERDVKGREPLLIAIQTLNLAAFEALLPVSDPNGKDGGGTSCLGWCARMLGNAGEVSRAMAAMLIAAGARVDCPCGEPAMTPLARAVLEENMEVFEVLVDNASELQISAELERLSKVGGEWLDANGSGRRAEMISVLEQRAMASIACGAGEARGSRLRL